MQNLTDDTTSAAPAACSSCPDPRVVALLDAADHAVAVIDAVLVENERIMASVNA